MFRKVIFYIIFVVSLCGYSFGQETPNVITKKVSKAIKKTQPLKILSKPPAIYTDKARMNNVQGTVLLRVTFLKTGKIGKIEIVKALPDGLTEQAIKAAEKIKFEPEIKKGKPQTVTKIMSYSFTIY